MSLTAPPSVDLGDPARPDIDDAVIKEAKRRARRRRWSYGGVVAVVLATVAAFVTWDATSPLSHIPTRRVRRPAARGCGAEQPAHRRAGGRDPH